MAVVAISAAGVALADNITGTQGDDVLTGTPFDDHIVGKKGNDTINALAGNDDVAGGKGNDVVNGDEGNDTLSGKKGADQINGGTGNDSINARDGKHGGPDTVTCGEDGEPEYSTDADTVRADKNDIVAADCESVDVTPHGSNGHGNGQNK
ncbi:MAG TPA: hypothetical protein VEK39_04770 [Solirubrobacterales bacterium]|nr:hypothetical protein [Solirubrobacterales bacterium]